MTVTRRRRTTTTSSSNPSDDALAVQARALIAEWERRYVPMEAWHEAVDVLSQISDEARRERAMELIAQSYERWAALWGEEERARVQAQAQGQGAPLP